MQEDLKLLNRLLKKKNISYSEFNELIGNYYVIDFEEFDDDSYLLKIMVDSGHGNEKKYYTDYVTVTK